MRISNLPRVTQLLLSAKPETEETWGLRRFSPKGLAASGEGQGHGHTDVIHLSNKATTNDFSETLSTLSSSGRRHNFFSTSLNCDGGLPMCQPGAHHQERAKSHTATLTTTESLCVRSTTTGSKDSQVRSTISSPALK